MADEIVVPPMRGQEEIQKAHDILGALVGDDEFFERTVPENWRAVVVACLDVLCWTLNHSGEAFLQILENVSESFEKSGRVLVRHDSYFRGPRPPE